MKKYAEKTYPSIQFILDDIINIKNHFNEKTIDGIIAMYSLFHIPKENINQLFEDIKNNYRNKTNTKSHIQSKGYGFFPGDSYSPIPGKYLLLYFYV